MTEYAFEEVSVPRGAFISWGNQIGQHVTGKVVDYSVAGGTDFSGEPCPQITIELLEPAASISKDGTRTDYPAGDLVVLNAGQVSLRRGLRSADPAVGDVIKITLENLVKVSAGEVKEMGIKIARGGRKADSPATFMAEPAANRGFSSTPPF